MVLNLKQRRLQQIQLNWGNKQVHGRPFTPHTAMFTARAHGRVRAVHTTAVFTARVQAVQCVHDGVYDPDRVHCHT